MLAKNPNCLKGLKKVVVDGFTFSFLFVELLAVINCKYGSVSLAKLSSAILYDL